MADSFIGYETEVFGNIDGMADEGLINSPQITEGLIINIGILHNNLLGLDNFAIMNGILQLILLMNNQDVIFGNSFLLRNSIIIDHFMYRNLNLP